jgi:hypothetical protein
LSEEEPSFTTASKEELSQRSDEVQNIQLKLDKALEEKDKEQKTYNGIL